MDKEEGQQPNTIDELRERLEDAEEMLRAIRAGRVDALVVSGPHGDQIYVLKGAEHPYRLMVESMTEGALILTQDGTISYSNRSFAAMLELPPAQIVGAAMNRFLAPEDLQNYGVLMQKAIAGSSKGEIRLKTNQGAVVPVDLSLSLFEGSGRRNLCVVVTDLRQQKRNHELMATKEHDRASRLAAEAARQRITNILESITDAFFAVNRDWLITYINQRAASIIGRPKEELIGLSLWELSPSQDEEVRKKYQKAMTERLALHSEGPALLINAHLKDKWFERHIYPTDEGLAVYFRDITEQKMAEDSLREARTQLIHVSRLTTMGELAASLAHELNQSLAAIVTNGDACLRWLGHSEPDLGEATSGIQRMIGDARRAGEVIAHTRAMLKKPVGETTAVDMTEVIREVLVLVHGEMERQRIVLHDHLAEDLPKVTGVRAQLQQVVLNLIVNAVEAMADVSERTRDLVIRSRNYAFENNPGLLVTVQDAGVGIAEENLSRLFEPFYTSKAQGLGLGLSISRSIIEAHGGRLWATRNADHGMTFQFIVPSVEHLE